MTVITVDGTGISASTKVALAYGMSITQMESVLQIAKKQVALSVEVSWLLVLNSSTQPQEIVANKCYPGSSLTGAKRSH